MSSKRFPIMAVAKSRPPTNLRLRQFCSQNLVLLTIILFLLFLWCYLQTVNEDTTTTTSLINDGPANFARNGTPDSEGQRKYELLETFRPEGNVSSASVGNDTGTGEGSAILHRRVKRGVLDLASMIKCVTGCNPFMYKDYGCYCGFQGDGYPVDGIDRCCFMHDHCYARVDCHQALVYFKPYKWSCGYGRAKCGMVSSSLCALQLCECDRRFAKCLSQYRCPHSKASCDITKNIIIGR